MKTWENHQIDGITECQQSSFLTFPSKEKALLNNQQIYSCF